MAFGTRYNPDEGADEGTDVAWRLMHSTKSDLSAEQIFSRRLSPVRLY